MLSAETYARCDAPLGARDLRALLEPLDVFSPNEEEAASMLGVRLPRRSGGSDGDGDGDAGGEEEDDDGERAAASAREAERLLLDPLLDAGPARGLTVTLRRGRRGALAKSSSAVAVGGGGGGGGRGSPSAGRLVRVPAVRGLAAIDPTGCGNAFCGAFVAAAHAGAGLREAVAWGCAAGGTMAEHEGVPKGAAAALASLAPVVRARARALLLRVEARASLAPVARGGARARAALASAAAKGRRASAASFAGRRKAPAPAGLARAQRFC